MEEFNCKLMNSTIPNRRLALTSKVISLMLMMFVCVGYVHAQRTWGDVEGHFDSICCNCNNAQMDSIMLSAIAAQDSIISGKKKFLILRLGKALSSRDSLLNISIVSGFDKLVNIENEKKKNVISVFKSLYSGSILSYQSGIITYLFNEQTIDILQFYVEFNTQ